MRCADMQGYGGQLRSRPILALVRDRKGSGSDVKTSGNTTPDNDGSADDSDTA
jgi:hypothetical protein